MSGKMEDPVTWKGLIAVLALMITIFTGMLTAGVSRADKVSEAAATAAKGAVSELRAEVKANKVEVDAGFAELRKDTQAIYQYLLTKQRQPRLEK